MRQRLLDLGAEHFEIGADDLEISAGIVRPRGVPHLGVPVAELVQTAMATGELILGSGSGIQPTMPENQAMACAGRVTFPAFVAPSFFCHAVRLRVDPETGTVHVDDIAAVHDFGRVINRVGAEGQVEGGVVHGVGIALTEGTQFTRGSQANPRLLDYKLQTASDVPKIRVGFVDRPAPDGGPRGIKGVGEPPVVPTAGAIGNAITAAVGVRVRRLPMNAGRVWNALSEDTKR